MRKSILVTLLVVVAAMPVQADLMLEYHDEQGAHAFSMYVKGKRMRMEAHGEHPTVTLFDADARELTLLDPAGRSYTVLNQETVRTMRRHLEQALQAMGSQGMDIPTSVQTQVVATGETRTVGEYECRMVRYQVEDQISTLACVVEPSAVGIGDSEWLTIAETFATLTDMASQLLPSGAGGLEMHPAAGIPVEASQADGTSVQTLTRVEHAPLADAMFRVPAGWRRVQIGR